MKENEENEDDLAELPPLLRDLFDWLLDHHEVESSGARWKVCLLVNRLLKLLGKVIEGTRYPQMKLHIIVHFLLKLMIFVLAFFVVFVIFTLLIHNS